LKRVAKDGSIINVHASLPMKFTHHPLMWLSWCVKFCQMLSLLMDFHCISLYINEDVTSKVREYNLWSEVLKWNSGNAEMEFRKITYSDNPVQKTKHGTNKQPVRHRNV
jgi:hypothetical protein